MRAALAVLLLAALPALAQDYERERRWEAEVVPNVVVGEAVHLELPSGRKFLGLYTPVANAKTAILLVHGIGVHPDHGVIGILRSDLADMGYATLSIQMPVLKPDATAEDYYPALFPEAAARIAAGAAWLAAKGYAHPVLLSHSMGSWMSEDYLARAPEAPFSAWVCLGRGGRFGDLRHVKLPVLDVYGEDDRPAVIAAAAARLAALRRVPGSRQVRIAGADHFYTGREKQLEAAIVGFLGALR